MQYLKRFKIYESNKNIINHQDKIVDYLENINFSTEINDDGSLSIFKDDRLLVNLFLRKNTIDIVVPGEPYIDKIGYINLNKLGFKLNTILTLQPINKKITKDDLEKWNLNSDDRNIDILNSFLHGNKLRRDGLKWSIETLLNINDGIEITSEIISDIYDIDEDIAINILNKL